MPPTEKQKKEVSKYIYKWRSRLYLQAWIVRTDYLHDDTDGAAAAVHIQTEYKQVVLTIQPKFWTEKPNMREMIIVHELCHCIVQPLVQLACDAGNGCAVSAREIDHWKESVTQHLTNAVYWPE